MKYESILSGQVRIWHASVSAEMIEEAISLRANIKHSVGEPTRGRSGSLFGDSYCSFWIVVRARTDSEHVLECCISTIENKLLDVQDLLVSGGWAHVYVVAHDPDVVQLSADANMISRLARIPAGLVVEFAAPEFADGADIGADDASL